MQDTYANLAQMIGMIKTSRNLGYHNEAPELSVKLFSGCRSIEELAAKAKLQGDEQTKLRHGCALLYKTAELMMGSPDARVYLDCLISNEPGLSSLHAHAAMVGIDYAAQCLENKALLTPKELDKLAFDKCAKRYDNVAFYNMPSVAIVHDRGTVVDIHEIKDETRMKEINAPKVGYVEGGFLIIPHSEPFTGTAQEAVDHLHKRGQPNFILTTEVMLAHYIANRYTLMRLWEAFKTSKIPLDDLSKLTKAGVIFDNG